MEQLIAIAVFAVCAAVCIRIFVFSYIMSSDSRQLQQALRAAENGAECYKASGGDAERAAALLGASAYEADGAAMVVAYYDREWRMCEAAAAVYCLQLHCREPEDKAAPFTGDLSVSRAAGPEIIAFTVAVRGDAD